MKEANKHIDYAIATAKRGLLFKSGILSWEIDKDPMISCVITDASHANESEEIIVNRIKSKEPHRSQGGKLICLGSNSLAEGTEGGIHLIAYSSTIVRRVCRSTMQAGAYSLQSGVEEGDRLRAAICDIFGRLDRKKWEESAYAFMRQIWFSDSRSVVDSLLNTKITKPADKRLSIELASLRQSLWRQPGQLEGDPHFQDERPRNPTDSIRWIDTNVMIADPLTKIMDSCKLLEAIEKNHWNIEQPINAIIVKKAKQLQRRKTATEELPEKYKKHIFQDGSFFVDDDLCYLENHPEKVKSLEDDATYPWRSTWIQKDGKWLYKVEDHVKWKYVNHEGEEQLQSVEKILTIFSRKKNY